jgi:hypothetical protein
MDEILLKLVLSTNQSINQFSEYSNNDIALYVLIYSIFHEGVLYFFLWNWESTNLVILRYLMSIEK